MISPQGVCRLLTICLDWARLGAGLPARPAAAALLAVAVPVPVLAPAAFAAPAALAAPAFAAAAGELEPGRRFLPPPGLVGLVIESLSSSVARTALLSAWSLGADSVDCPCGAVTVPERPASGHKWRAAHH